MLDIIGVPFDKCGKYAGSALGPAALRFEHIAEVLRCLGSACTDTGDISIAPAAEPEGGIPHFEEAMNCFRALKDRTAKSLESSRVPLILAGDHSAAIGSISAAMEKYGDKLAVLWIDAHADINTPENSPSGNMHGMPLAALTRMQDRKPGLQQDQWNHLLETVVPQNRLQMSQIAWIGLRDVDSAEREAIALSTSAFASTMQDVDRYGSTKVFDAFDRWMIAQGHQYLWVSFDVDCMDPQMAPGTGTSVRGGFTYREAHFLAEKLHEWLNRTAGPYRLAGVEVVEVNPVLDTQNETARAAVEWMASLFGRNILSGRPDIDFN